MPFGLFGHVQGLQAEVCIDHFFNILLNFVSDHGRDVGFFLGGVGAVGALLLVQFFQLLSYAGEIFMQRGFFFGYLAISGSHFTPELIDAVMQNCNFPFLFRFDQNYKGCLSIFFFAHFFAARWRAFVCFDSARLSTDNAPIEK